MNAGLSAVTQDVRVAAPGILQGVGEDGEAVVVEVSLGPIEYSRLLRKRGQFFGKKTLGGWTFVSPTLPMSWTLRRSISR
jgi:hypothetical protein